MVSRRDFLKNLGVSVAALTLPGCFLSPQKVSGTALNGKRPNILFIFSDDHTRQTIGVYGGRLAKLNPSPNIDRLAKEGMRFNHCYVGNSICAPSRATLLTGKHSHLNGKIDNNVPFNHDQQQFQKILQTNGYQTVMIGKIHLDGKMQGFDYWDVLPGQGVYFDPVFISEEGQTSYKGYVTDIITEKSVDWLKNKRNESKPFMLMVHHKAPHRSWQPADRHLHKYDEVEIPEPDNLFDDYATRTTAAHQQEMSIDKTMKLSSDLKINESPEAQVGRYADRNKYFAEHKLSGKALVKWKYQTYVKDYLRCTAAVDESVGHILDTLRELKLDDNTIVIYSSDQGFYMGEHGWFDKRFMYEESYSTPLLARWPGKIKPGSQNNDLVQNIDFAETFLDLAGAPIPDDMQGKSLVPLLRGDTPKDWRTSLYYHYYEYPAVHSVRRHEGVSDKRCKLICFYGQDVPNGQEWEFYDLQKDPSEMNNIYNRPENAAKIADMKKELGRLKEYYKVPEYLPLQGAPEKNKEKTF